jgi:hypothetical protein
VSVELSILDALLSKRHSEVHKSRVSSSYSWIYIYFDHVIRMPYESTSPELTSLCYLINLSPKCHDI